MHKIFFLFLFLFTFTFAIDHFEEIENFTFNKSKITIDDISINKFSIMNKIYLEKLIEGQVEDQEVKDLSIAENNFFVSAKEFKKEKKMKIIESKFKEDSFLSELSLVSLSPDWQNQFSDKKAKFIKMLLPLVAYENQKIISEREKLTGIKKYLEFKKTLLDNDVLYLKNMSQKYKINLKNKHKIDVVDELLIKVDIIPNSIVLAQAINESAWGTSRFAREYNALFGQYTYDTDNGVVPNKRDEGKKHLIKNFSSVNKSIESYFVNINSHYAYEEFRIKRNKIKKKDIKYDFKELTSTLTMYAEDKDYVKTLNSIIDTNDLSQFDHKLNIFINS